jgi:hypothetical protein
MRTLDRDCAFGYDSRVHRRQPIVTNYGCAQATRFLSRFQAGPDSRCQCEPGSYCPHLMPEALPKSP